MQLFFLCIRFCFLDFYTHHIVYCTMFINTIVIKVNVLISCSFYEI